MTRQILKLNDNGKKYTVVYREGQGKPYCVYKHSMKIGKYGYPTESKNMVMKSADMRGCLLHIATEF